MAEAIEKLIQFLAAQGVRLSRVQKALQIKSCKKFTMGW